MKVLAFAFLLAVASATPNRRASDIEAAVRSGSERLVTGQIIRAIEDLAESIRDAGLDPLEMAPYRLDYAVAVDTVFNARGYHDGVTSYGLSNIVVNRMNYAALTSRLTFEIELPLITFNINNGLVDANCLGGNWNGRTSGSLAIRNIKITGNIRVSIGILTGISIRSLDMGFSVGAIDSNLRVAVLNWDFSDWLNEFLGAKVPNALKTHEKDINDLLSIVAREIAEANL